MVFHALDRTHIEDIARIQLKPWDARLEKLEMNLAVSAAALATLADVGFDSAFGAQPPKRAIQQRIENPVNKLVLQGCFVPRDVSPVGVGGGEYLFPCVTH